MKNIVYVENECFVGVTKEGLKFSNIKTKEKKYLTFDDRLCPYNWCKF